MDLFSVSLSVFKEYVILGFTLFNANVIIFTDIQRKAPDTNLLRERVGNTGRMRFTCVIVWACQPTPTINEGPSVFACIRKLLLLDAGPIKNQIKALSTQAKLIVNLLPKPRISDATSFCNPAPVSPRTVPRLPACSVVQG